MLKWRASVASQGLKKGNIVILAAGRKPWICELLATDHGVDSTVCARSRRKTDYTLTDCVPALGAQFVKVRIMRRDSAA